MYGRSAQGPDGGQPCVCHPRRALLCRIQKTTDHDRPPLPALLAHTPAQCSSPPSRRQEVHHAHGHHPRPSRWRHAYYGEFRMDGRAAALVCVLPMLAPCPCWPRVPPGALPGSTVRCAGMLDFGYPLRVQPWWDRQHSADVAKGFDLMEQHHAASPSSPLLASHISSATPLFPPPR